jgi:hypothetical protein
MTSTHTGDAAAMPAGARRWLLLRADLGRPLPIATASVDRVLCHDTLEAQGVVAMAERSGRFTAVELDGWLASLEGAAARGDYLFSLNDYIVVAAKEPAEAANPAS